MTSSRILSIHFNIKLPATAPDLIFAGVAVGEGMWCIYHHVPWLPSPCVKMM
jgi:hypothetical protein